MIVIQNIYYMLSYAFQTLRAQKYRKLGVEAFHNVAELFAAILAQGIASQLKRGLGREYIVRTETTPSLRGKLEISESVKSQVLLQKRMICTHDDFSEKYLMNRILKSTVMMLLQENISDVRKKKLRKLLVPFSDVEPIDLHLIDWKFRYNRNNQTYRMLLSICYLTVKGLLQTNSIGKIQLMDFLDEQRMSRLYEKFILEYYRQEFPKIRAAALQIPWQLDDGRGDLLPVMQSDVVLSHKNRTLIIDAKYYACALQRHYDVRTQHSHNLYQIFTYVKNKEASLLRQPHTVSGMLLYAKTDEDICPDSVYYMSGNKISVKTLDLNQSFSGIRAQLDDIVCEHFGVSI